MGNGVQKRPSKHVARAVAVHGGNAWGGHVVALPVLQHHAARGPTRHAQRARPRRQRSQGRVKLVLSGGLKRFGFVAKQIVHTFAPHGVYALAAKPQHVDVAERQRQRHARLHGQRAPLQRRGAPRGGGCQVALHVVHRAVCNGLGVHGAFVQQRRGTQVGAHGALGVGGDQHQARAGVLVGGVGGLQLRLHAQALKVLRVKVAVLVVGHAAGVVRLPTQLSKGHHRVGRRAPAGAPGAVAV